MSDLRSRIFGIQYRGELTNEQWEKVAPLLPPQKPVTGRPANEHRQVVDGILWKLRTGAPWRDLPEYYGNWTTVYKRFQRWRKHEVWKRVLAELQTLVDQPGGHIQETHFQDGPIIRAHSPVDAPGATMRQRQKITPSSEGSGCSQAV